MNTTIPPPRAARRGRGMSRTRTDRASRPRRAGAGLKAHPGGPRRRGGRNDATGPTGQHNLFRTGGGHIHAPWFSFEQGWHREDRGGG